MRHSLHCPESITNLQYMLSDIFGEKTSLSHSHTNTEISPVYAKDKPYIQVDLDVSPFDNSKTKKEGVERTYKGCDGYSPVFAYIGQEGHCLHVEMRKGNVHCQKVTPNFIKKTIKSAKRLTDQPLLFRLESGNDSRDYLIILLENHVFLILRAIFTLFGLSFAAFL
ncbi:UNVERIFIED_ORG: hypothetical protein ABRZ91_002658 [Heyndrickxia coagulans]